MGLSAFSQLALDAGRWQSGDWACQRGLFTEVYDSIEEMDAAMDLFISDLLQKNELALQALKKIFWEGTDHWESLLTERAKTSGRLILSDVAQQAIQAFLQKSN
jgi:methylglutaconyl-CoA hydratase